MSRIKVLKLNLTGEVTWQYEGRVLQREPDFVTLEAFFNRPDLPFIDVVFKEHDRFVETFYYDRWYNIFEVHDREDDKLKGWYCNISRPAVIATDSLGKETVSYVDLALDLWVSENGKQTVLDEDEFEALPLDRKNRDQALAAMSELKAIFLIQHIPPFD
jgi:hypothetical protein